MGKILPVILALIGVGTGIGAGVLLKSDPETQHGDVADCTPQTNEGGHADQAPVEIKQGEEVPPEYVKMNNQFVIPILNDGKMSALVVMSISLEVRPGGKEATFQREPKLRDAFNQVLFDYANSGGFDGVFTNSNNMVVLRDSLYEVAQKVAGPIVQDILINDIVRQDIQS